MASISLFGIVGLDFVASDIRAQLARLEASGARTLEVRIDSPGGEVFQGQSIYNSLRTSSFRSIEVTIDGLAASAASLIAMAGTRILMQPLSQIMIHEAFSNMGGTADQMRQEAKLLDVLNAQYAEVYSARTGIAVTEVRSLMKAETWFDAPAAVRAGFADQVIAPARQVAWRLPAGATPGQRQVVRGLVARAAMASNQPARSASSWRAPYAPGVDARRYAVALLARPGR